MIAELEELTNAYDVIVLGSGAAGLTAALAAHDGGASVLILEKTEYIGGTSAVSGGGIWIPNNHLMQQNGLSDSREEALLYCMKLGMGRVKSKLIEKFIDTAPLMLKYLENSTPLKFSLLSTPDYFPEVAGGKLKGRSVEPQPYSLRGLPDEWKIKLRPPSMMTFAMTLQEIYHDYQAFYRPWEAPQDVLIERMANQTVTLGQALIAPLIESIVSRKIPIVTNTRATELIKENEVIVGVHALHKDSQQKLKIKAKVGVILATAGFEWNQELQKQFLTAPIDYPNSPPFNEGDGLKMAMAVGANIANMSEVWNYPSIVIPGETYENKTLARGIKAERSAPHIIWINGDGERFVNEAANYNSVGRSFYNIDTNQPQYLNMPAWAILDSQYREQYMVGTTMPEDQDPEWLISADTIAELANKISVSAIKLEKTIDRWNSFVINGKDLDFKRGDSAFDKYQGDRKAPHPNLGTIEKGPFYAFNIYPGALGTKGGPCTDEKAQVLDVNNNVIKGLYAAGNVAANITGPSYYGVGSTLGPAMTWGYIAGIAATQKL